MLPIQSFNPGNLTAFPNGNGAIQVGAADAGSKILFYNESNYNLIIDFLNGNQDTLHAWEARWWPLDGDTKQVDWSIDSVLATTNTPPISKVMGTLYGAQEQVPGTYPVSLVRQTNIGNTVGTNQVSSTLNNTVNGPNTNVVTIQPTDATSPTTTGDTSGNWLFQGDNAGVLTTLLQLIAGASPRVKLAEASVITEILGNLLVDGILTWGSTLSASNQLINLLQSYGLFSDNVGSLGTTRIWLDGPDRGEFHGGPRSGANWFDEVSFRTTQFQVSLGKNTSPNSTLFSVSGGPTSLDGGKITTDNAGNITHANNTGVMGTKVGGGTLALLVLNPSNNTFISAPASQNIVFQVGSTALAQVSGTGLDVTGGYLAMASDGGALSISTGMTVLTNLSTQEFTSPSSVTGIILTKGVVDGQIFIMINVGAGSITFAAAATSFVSGGTAIVIGAGNTAMFSYSTVDQLWHRIVAN